MAVMVMVMVVETKRDEWYHQLHRANTNPIKKWATPRWWIASTPGWNIVSRHVVVETPWICRTIHMLRRGTSFALVVNRSSCCCCCHVVVVVAVWWWIDRHRMVSRNRVRSQWKGTMGVTTRVWQYRYWPSTTMRYSVGTWSYQYHHTTYVMGTIGI